ncbi:hypothetical protein F2P81_019938 [Scophthalmus maximus]|uniref:Uncharacterized protein n=1 Tax=Scophthalmus maximus TaxID=52904 RepID=A0A6A4S2G5_SCOMX|nr:hypothetical protein F2P81_019938 [Scophthalmus maximus]
MYCGSVGHASTSEETSLIPVCNVELPPVECVDVRMCLCMRMCCMSLHQMLHFRHDCPADEDKAAVRSSEQIPHGCRRNMAKASPHGDTDTTPSDAR